MIIKLWNKWRFLEDKTVVTCLKTVLNFLAAKLYKMNFEGRFFLIVFTCLNVGNLKIKLVKKADNVGASGFCISVYVQSH